MLGLSAVPTSSAAATSSAGLSSHAQGTASAFPLHGVRASMAPGNEELGDGGPAVSAVGFAPHFSVSGWTVKPCDSGRGGRGRDDGGHRGQGPGRLDSSAGVWLPSIALAPPQPTGMREETLPSRGTNGLSRMPRVSPSEKGSCTPGDTCQDKRERQAQGGKWATEGPRGPAPFLC